MATLIWQYKTTSGASYTDALQPTTYGVDEEDLDDSSYRSINTGNLIDNVVSYSWVKLKLSYKKISATQMKTLLPMLRTNPLYIKIQEPLFGNDTQEYEVRCSKKNYDMNLDGTWELNFNLVQKKKVTGQ